MIRHELYKLITTKSVMFSIIVVLVANIFILWHVESGSKEYSPAEYCEFWDELTVEASEKGWEAVLENYDVRFDEFDMTGLSGIERIEFKMSGTYYRKYLYEDVKEEIEFQIGYAEYLEGIESAAKRYEMMAFFGDKDSYAYREIMKIKEIYADMDRIELEPAQSSGIEMAANSMIADILAVVALLCVAVTLWLKEKEQKVLLLIRTTYHGRSRLAVSKLMVMMASAIFIGLVLYGGNAVAASFMYGLGELDRPLAAVYDYGHTMWEISTGEFLLYNVLFKIVAYILVAFLISAVCCKFSSSLAAFGTVIAFGAVGCLMYYKIPFLSKFAVLKFFNPFAILKTELLFKDFMGFDFGGYPVDYRVCMAVVLPVGILLFIVTTLKFFADYIIKGGSGVKFGNKMVLALRRLTSRLGSHTSLLRHELYRVIVCCGIGVILLVFIGFTVYESTPYKVKYPNMEAFALRTYLEQLKGPLTEEKAEFIDDEMARVRALSDDWSAAQKRALFVVEQRQLYIEQNGGACFLYDEPHNMLTAMLGNITDFLRSVVCMILISLIMPCFFAPDLQSGVCRVIEVTERGKRELPGMRYMVGVIFAVFVAAMAHIPYFVQIMVSYNVDMEVFSYPVNSLEHLSCFGYSMSIGAYYAIIYSLKILFTVISAIFVFGLSRLLKSQAYTTLMGFILLVVPTLAAMYDNRMEPVTYPCAAMYGNMFMQNRMAAVWCVAAVVLVSVAMKLLIRVRAKR